MAKTTRIDIRVDPDVKQLLDQAAALEDCNLSAWMLAIAYREAVRLVDPDHEPADTEQGFLPGFGLNETET